MTDPDVREEIMTATYEVLCEHGYTELTARDIADRTDKSKSRLFYHYDSTDALIADFVDFLLEEFERRVAAADDRPPVERLATFVDSYLYEPSADVSFHTALLELRAQASRDERYRKRFAESDDRLRTILEEILRDGQAAGQFREHDPGRIAALLLAALDGALVRKLTVGRDSYPDEVRAATSELVLEEVLADDVAFPAKRNVTPIAGFEGTDRTAPESDRAAESRRHE